MSAAAASSDDGKLQTFLQWLQANGADLRGCAIRACGRKGFGVYSTAAEASDDDGVVMVVPLDLAVTPMRVLQDPLVGPRCRALFEEGGVDDRLLVMLFLIAERLRPSSLWKPYLDMLPSTFGSSVWFDDDDLAALEGTTLHRATVMQRKSLQKLFNDKVKGLVEELLRVDGSGSSIEVRFEDFLWANSIFWTRALNIPLPHSYVFPGSLSEQQISTGEVLGDSSLATQQEADITVKNVGDENSESHNMESIWVEGLVPGIDFCNHNVKALATWEVDSVGNTTGIPASMYLILAQAGKNSVETGTEICINYGNKGNEELLYLYGFVVDNNPDDYLMVHYPIEALRQVQSADIKMKLIEMQKAELRCLLPTNLLNSGFFGTSTNSGDDDDNKKNASHFSSYSWSGQRKVPSYLHKNVFPQEFLSTLRTIAMQEYELEQVASLLGEVGSNEDTEPSDAEVRSAIWEVCGDHGALGLLVDILRVKMAELEEGTGTEAADGQLLEKFDSNDPEDSLSVSVEGNAETKSRVNSRSCIVYRRGQKRLTRLFLREAERLLELSVAEQT